MEFAKRRKRRRKDSGMGKFMVSLMVVGTAVYIITASAAGTWLAEKVMAPAFTALSELPFFSSSLDELAEEQQSEQNDSLSVSISSNRTAVETQVDLPAISCFALQMGAFSSEENANALAQNIQERGGGGYVYNDGSIYRVLATGYSSEAEAKTVKDRLISEGSDCTVYAISSPAVTFNITAEEAESQSISQGFSALCSAQAALAKACIDYDNGMTQEEGAKAVSDIAQELSAASSPLAQFRESSAAISEVYDCCEKCISVLSAAAIPSDELSSNMKYSLLQISHEYAQLLSSIAE